MGAGENAKNMFRWREGAGVDAEEWLAQGRAGKEAREFFGGTRTRALMPIGWRKFGGMVQGRCCAAVVSRLWYGMVLSVARAGRDLEETMLDLAR